MIGPTVSPCSCSSVEEPNRETVGPIKAEGIHVQQYITLYLCVEHCISDCATTHSNLYVTKFVKFAAQQLYLDMSVIA